MISNFPMNRMQADELKVRTPERLELQNRDSEGVRRRRGLAAVKNASWRGSYLGESTQTSLCLMRSRSACGSSLR
jgi:hypothetical protein